VSFGGFGVSVRVNDAPRMTKRNLDSAGPFRAPRKHL